MSGRVARGAETGSIMIETLVAVLILAALSGAWFETIATTSRHREATAARTAAMLVARSQLDTAGVVEAVAAGSRRGRDGRFDWEIVTEPQPGGNLARVTVTVRSERGAALARLSTLRLQS